MGKDEINKLKRRHSQSIYISLAAIVLSIASIIMRIVFA